MRFYRIADSRFQPQSGDGARTHGGRWNSPGRAVIYACETLSGAMLEKLVHTSGRIPKRQACVTFESPDSLPISTIAPDDTLGWDLADMIASRAAGDSWLRAMESAILLVPSVVFGVERNALINPAHPDFRQVKVVSIELMRWDERLFEGHP